MPGPRFRSSRRSRTRLAAVAVTLTVVLGSAVACGSSSVAPRPSVLPAVPARVAAATPTPTPSRTPHVLTAADILIATDAWGTAPQTMARPGDSVAFRQRIGLLWDAVVSGNPGPALGAFFPLSAYRQVKAISDPQHDWQTRLVALFDADIGAIHAQLGTSPRLVGATVPENAATWVLPGAEYNKESYWRVYGTRVNYVASGQQRSFGICSLISWRGQWFPVHLGPINRSGTAGALCPPGE